jgi:hypothetical protein
MSTQNITIAGRPAVLTNIGRVRAKKGWRFYNLVSVRFLDNDEYHSMGAGDFARWSTRLDRAAHTKAEAPLMGEPQKETLQK